MRTGTWRDRMVAWGLVLGWHALLGWVLVRAVQGMPDTDAGDAPAMLAQFIVLSPSRATPAAPPSQRIDPARHARAARPAPHAPAPASALSVVELDPGPQPPPDLAAQVQAQARQAAPIAFGPRDPLADRTARLPSASDDTFRMRRTQHLGHTAVAVMAYLFAPKGYDADPCPRTRDNIGNLMASGDSAALRQELDTERRKCRP